MDFKGFSTLLVPSWIDEEQVLQIIDNNTIIVDEFAFVSLCEETCNYKHRLSNNVRVLYDASAIRQMITLAKVAVLPAIIRRNKNDQIVAVDTIPYQSKTIAEQTPPPSTLTELATGELLAAAMTAYDAFDLPTAAACFYKITSQDATHKAAHFNMACVLHMCDLPTLAISYAEQVLVLDSSDMTCHSFLWALARNNNNLACKDIAVQSYRRILASTGDVRSAHKLTTLTGEGQLAVSGDPEYARHIYDDMAESFENKLVNTLEYRGPWIMKDMIQTVLRESEKDMWQENDRQTTTQPAVVGVGVPGVWRILDLGCGSGLCGRVFADFIAQSVSASPSESSPFPTQSADTDTITGTNIDTAIPVRVAVSPDAGTTNTPPTDSLSVPLPLPPPPVTVTVTVSTTTTTVCYESAEELLKVCSSVTGSVMIGVDISRRILDIAKDNGGYNVLYLGDASLLLHRLSVETERGLCSPFHLILCADMFIYIGALANFFHHVRSVLHTGGLFSFTTEALETSPMRQLEGSFTSPPPTDNGGGEHAKNDSKEPEGAVPGWGVQLLTSARFAHSKGYVDALSNSYGFKIMSHRDIILRKEEATSLPGHVFVLMAI
eukprot:gene353-635_t